MRKPWICVPLGSLQCQSACSTFAFVRFLPSLHTFIHTFYRLIRKSGDSKFLLYIQCFLHEKLLDSVNDSRLNDGLVHSWAPIIHFLRVKCVDGIKYNLEVLPPHQGNVFS